MSNIDRLLHWLICAFSIGTGIAAIWFASATPSDAQVLELRPVQLQFSSQRPIQAFTLINRAAQPATVQVRAFKWTQDATGKDVLVPTQDLMISPPFVQLGVGDSQVLRVRYLAGQHETEGAYRLLIDQLPVARADTGVRTALRLSMPAFVPSLAGPAPKVSWSWSLTGAGGTSLTVINQGAAHAVISDLQVRTPSGQPVSLPRNGSAYMLSGAQRRWTFDAADLPGGLHGPSLQVAGAP